MRWALELVTGPESEPVELARMKREMGEFADITDRDDDISAQITAGREWVEQFTGRVLFDQTWRLTVMAETIPADDMSIYVPSANVGSFEWRKVGEIMLRKSPALAIVSLKSVDSDGVETTVDSSHYELREADSKSPRIVALSGATWPSQAILRLTFRAGYADTTGSPQETATVIPERYKQAIILYVKSLYDNKPEYMKTAEALIRGERCQSGFA